MTCDTFYHRGPLFAACPEVKVRTHTCDSYGHTHLAHQLVHTLSPSESQVVLRWQGVVVRCSFHLPEVLPVFYLEE